MDGERHHPRSLATTDFNLLEDTMSVADVNIADHDAIYLPGRHAVMFDLPQSERLASLITEFYESDKTVWPLCHRPDRCSTSGPVTATTWSRTRMSLVFSWPEEELAQRGEAVPFSRQDNLKARGGKVHPRRPAV
jgi:putative intracellular protease/amidase